MNIPPTNVDRNWTNTKVWKQAEEEIGKDLMTFSEMWQRQKFRLLGHILRTSPDDPLKQVCFEENTRRIHQGQEEDGYLVPRVTTLREGKPRGQWVLKTMQEAFHIIDEGSGPYDPWNRSHSLTLKHFAKARHGIFGHQGSELPNSPGRSTIR